VLNALSGFRQNIAQLMDGVLRQYAVLEIEWGRDDNNWQEPLRLHWRHPNRFNFTAKMVLVKYDVGEDPYPGTPLEEFGADRFIVHAPWAGRSAYPTRRGVLRTCMFPSLTKRYGLRWWLVAAERFGQPAPYVTVPEGSADLFERAQEMLRNLTSDWQAVLTSRMDIKTIPGSGSFTGDIHGRLVDLVNSECSIAVLGQNLSTEVTGGSFAAALAHEAVRADYLAADAVELGETIRRFLIEPLVRFNWPGAPVPVFEFQLVPEEQKEILPWHFSEGVVDENEVRESVGRAPREPVLVGGVERPRISAMHLATITALVAQAGQGLIAPAAVVGLIASAMGITPEQARLALGAADEPAPGVAPPPALPAPAAPVEPPTPDSVAVPPSVGRTAYDRPFVPEQMTLSLPSPMSTRWRTAISRALSNTSGE
jgi:hypothetical protein